MSHPPCSLPLQSTLQELVWQEQEVKPIAPHWLGASVGLRPPTTLTVCVCGVGGVGRPMSKTREASL